MPWLSSEHFRTNRNSKNDIYIEMSLLDLENKYNGTEAGRYMLFLNVGSNHHVWECFDSNTSVFWPLSIRQGIRGWDQKVPERKATPRETGGSIESFYWSFLYILGCLTQIFSLHLSSLQSCVLQFRNDPKMRIYKVYEHTKSKSGSGWLIYLENLHFAIQQFQKPNDLKFPQVSASLLCHCFRITNLKSQTRTNDYVSTLLALKHDRWHRKLG